MSFVYSENLNLLVNLDPPNYVNDYSMNLGCLIKFNLMLFLRKRLEYGHLTACKKASACYLIRL